MVESTTNECGVFLVDSGPKKRTRCIEYLDLAAALVHICRVGVVHTRFDSFSAHNPGAAPPLEGRAFLFGCL